MRWNRALMAVAGLALVVGCTPGTGQDGGGGKSSGDKKLTYLYFTDGPDEQATRGLIGEFEKKTGAKVDLQIVPFDSLETAVAGPSLRRQAAGRRETRQPHPVPRRPARPEDAGRGHRRAVPGRCPDLHQR